MVNNVLETRRNTEEVIVTLETNLECTYLPNSQVGDRAEINSDESEHNDALYQTTHIETFLTMWERICQNKVFLSSLIGQPGNWPDLI